MNIGDWRSRSSQNDGLKSPCVSARLITLRRCGIALLVLAPLLVTSCGGSDSGVPTTPLVWGGAGTSGGTWDQVRWQ